MPLTALRAFEAAGRHQSFKKAAEELAVSEAAISRQVRDLEAALGIDLFSRGHRSVTLTDAGNRLQRQLNESFDAIGETLSAIAAPAPFKTVRVSVEPTFAAIFLIPRLADFTAGHPDIDVQIESNSELVEMGRGEIGLAIRYSLKSTAWPGAQAQHLVDNLLTPMIAPGQSADLSAMRLLRDEDDGPWRRWLDRAAFRGTPLWGTTFSNAAIALQSAELGHGAALGDRRLARHLLERGRLVAPFDTDIENGAYWLVAKDFRRLTISESIFCDWLRHELAKALAMT